MPVRSRLRHLVPVVAVAFVAMLGLCPTAAADDDPGTIWLCRPGQAENPCGTTTDAPVDCFYVYPTVSLQPTANADRTPGPEQRTVARQQAAPFDGRCNVWAPMYRQGTLLGLFASPGAKRSPALDLAYEDVDRAWTDYLAHHNHGRGVVFLGHSQGSVMLRTLLRTRIDGTPDQRLLVSAILPGANVLVRRGTGIGGDFDAIPACTRTGEIGCVIAYSTFAATPPPKTRFGLAPTEPNTSGTRGGFPYGPDYDVLCTDPAALATGADTGLHGVLTGRPVDAYRGHCTTSAPHVLMIEGGGDGVPPATALPTIPDATWGLHLLDIDIAQRDLLDLVSAQTATWLDGQGPQHN
ncbi:DUF3089 domain-containing protein [Nocardia sp. NPDC004068]|uniref:DUF3089 domain-containing protein n=1 Tax=Nocardia sp. NPDC004068 TaxID=3364303 RepID=UPI003693720E